MTRNQNLFPGRGFQSLLLFLLSFILLGPTIRTHIGGILLIALFTLILLSAVYSLSERRATLIAVSFLAVPSIALNWIATLYHPSHWFMSVTYFINILFLLYVIVIIIKYVFFSGKIHPDLLFGALSGYLLIAILWAMFYAILENMTPGSFAELMSGVPENDFLSRKFEVLLYYSLITLTTLGYGDITPLTPLAKSLSALEAVIGQFYIAILVAGLVGILSRPKISK